MGKRHVLRAFLPDRTYLDGSYNALAVKQKEEQRNVAADFLLLLGLRTAGSKRSKHDAGGGRKGAEGRGGRMPENKGEGERS